MLIGDISNLNYLLQLIIIKIDEKIYKKCSMEIFSNLKLITYKNW